MAGLTDKQQRFVAEYLIDLNAAAAARRAGYSEKTADRIGSRLMHTPAVAAAIQEAQEARSNRMQIKQDDVLAQIAAVAMTDIRAIAEWCEQTDDAGLPVTVLRLKPSGELSADAAAAVHEVRIDGQGRLTLKLHDKLRALELLGKHLGMFKEQIEIEHRGRLADLFEEIRQQAATRPLIGDTDG